MVWSRFLVVTFLALITYSAQGQKNRYVVFFNDKNSSPYSVTEPAAFLSARAIERRVKQNLAVTEDDLPVNINYVKGVKDAGAEVYFTTRWMNGILVQCEPELVSAITGLSYVKNVELVAPGASLLLNGRVKTPNRGKGAKAAVTDTQLEMIGIDQMHSEGIKGEGIIIAILDAGFPGVDVIEPFAHLRNENKIDMTMSKDFVYNSNSVFQYDDHGTEVFSVIGALEAGAFTGGAPEASFQLYVTEEVPTEYRVEEYNWLFAAERADSSGADIIQSSLGYYDFDGTAFDYLKSEIDGATTVVSRAAQMAADRGLVIVVSAGNEGNISWQIITPPADARDVLAVASVNAERVRANSSSIGPTADGRTKPDVAAMGVSTSVITSGGNIGKATGTSLAAPLITSLAAGVWQKYPALSNLEVMNAIRISGSQAKRQDNLLGFGIPHYPAIVAFMENLENEDFFSVYPNPASDSVVIRPLFPDEVPSCSVEFISSDGKSISASEVSFSRSNPFYSKNLLQFSAGVYFIRINWNGKHFIYRLVKE